MVQTVDDILADNCLLREDIKNARIVLTWKLSRIEQAFGIRLLDAVYRVLPPIVPHGTKDVVGEATFAKLRLRFKLQYFQGWSSGIPGPDGSLKLERVVSIVLDGEDWLLEDDEVLRLRPANINA